MDELAEYYRGWIEEAVKKARLRRDGKWTESIAVGSESFVTETKERLGFKAGDEWRVKGMVSLS
jgi:putative transposase